MAHDDWLEQRTRIPFAGIIAIVLIVAVVAVFLRSGLDRVLPTGEVTVDASSGSEQLAQGGNVRGSASFSGERDVPLVYKERLQGMLSSRGGALTFVVDVPAKSMALIRDGVREDVLLSVSDDGLSLVAQFEHDGMPAGVAVSPSERTLSWRTAGQPGVDVALTDVVSYEGFFLYSGTQHLLQFSPAGSYVTIAAAGQQSRVPLTGTQDVLSGMWYDAQGEGRPVTVDAADLHATVGELW